MTSAAPASRGPPVTHLELQAVDHRRVVLHGAAAHSPKAGPWSGRAPPQRPFIPSSPGGAEPELFQAHPGFRRAHFLCFPDESSMRSSPAANGGSAGLVRMLTWLPSGLSAPIRALTSQAPESGTSRGGPAWGLPRGGGGGAERSRPGPARLAVTAARRSAARGPPCSIAPEGMAPLGL